MISSKKMITISELHVVSDVHSVSQFVKLQFLFNVYLYIRKWNIVKLNLQIIIKNNSVTEKGSPILAFSGKSYTIRCQQTVDQVVPSTHTEKMPLHFSVADIEIDFV